MKSWYDRNVSATAPPDPVEREPANYRAPRRRRARDPKPLAANPVRYGIRPELHALRGEGGRAA